MTTVPNPPADRSRMILFNVSAIGAVGLPTVGMWSFMDLHRKSWSEPGFEPTTFWSKSGLRSTDWENSGPLPSSPCCEPAASDRNSPGEQRHWGTAALGNLKNTKSWVTATLGNSGTGEQRTLGKVGCSLDVCQCVVVWTQCARDDSSELSWSSFL